MVVLTIGAVALVCAVIIIIIGGFAWFLYAVHTNGKGMAIIFPQMYDRHGQR